MVSATLDVKSHEIHAKGIFTSKQMIGQLEKERNIYITTNKISTFLTKEILSEKVEDYTK